jgi:hypothetical protein
MTRAARAEPHPAVPGTWGPLEVERAEGHAVPVGGGLAGIRAGPAVDKATPTLAPSGIDGCGEAACGRAGLSRGRCPLWTPHRLSRLRRLLGNRTGGPGRPATTVHAPRARGYRWPSAPTRPTRRGSSPRRGRRRPAPRNGDPHGACARRRGPAAVARPSYARGHRPAVAQPRRRPARRDPRTAARDVRRALLAVEPSTEPSRSSCTAIARANPQRAAVVHRVRALPQQRRRPKPCRLYRLPDPPRSDELGVEPCTELQALHASWSRPDARRSAEPHAAHRRAAA